ncbi:MAG: DNA translocase FtsK [Acutalibacteraceae bacterium]
MAAKKSSKGRKPTVRAKQEQAEGRQKAAIVLFGIALVFLALVVFRFGNFWAQAHEYLLGLFGWTAFVIPVYMGYTAFAISKGFDGKSKAIITESSFSIFLLGALTNVIALEGDLSKTGLLHYSQDAYNLAAKAGGWLSSFVAYPLTYALTKPGAIVLLVIAILVLLMLITRLTVAKLMRGVSKPVIRLRDDVKDAYREYKEHTEEEETADYYPPHAGDSESPDIDIPIDGENRRKMKAAAKKKKSEEIERKRNILHALYNGEEINAANPESQDGEFNSQAKASDIDDIINKKKSEAAKPAEKTAEEPNRENADKKMADGSLQKTVSPIKVEAQMHYNYPPLSLLDKPSAAVTGDDDDLKANAEKLINTLRSFGVETRILDISRGPAVTRYELQPAAGVRVNKITNLADDIALNLAANGVRIEAPIPGKAAVGIEIPNKSTSVVKLRDIVESKEFMSSKSKLTFAVGKDLGGKCITADIGKMPHLLIAGATGSGKSVCINSLITSLLFKASPDEVKFVMIDPKRIELAAYNGIPHLLVPVVTDVKKAAGALNWAVNEMQKRYNLFGEVGAKKLSEYNEIAVKTGEFNPLPQVVIIIDELAELMMIAPGDVEDYICRLAQLARAAGMHLVIATQRPSVDVITGLIKANVPSRIAFAVANQFDSRTIIDQGGAEKLLGCGDMLFYPVGANKPTRVQGCYVSDSEIDSVIKFIKENAAVEYNEEVQQEIEKLAVTEKGKGSSSSSQTSDISEANGDEELIQAAIEVVVEAEIASTSLLQRKLKLGYARAARIVDEMEQRGIVGPFEGSKPRKVLISKERWLEMKNQQE